MLTVVHAHLPADPASVASARQLAADAAAGLPASAREAVELVTSELATNSVVHAGTPFEVFLATDDTVVEVVVADQTGWVITPDADSSIGHGLLLVGLLATEWAAVIEGPGKRVWARLEAHDVPTW